MPRARAIALALPAALTLACGGSAKAKLQFRNDTTASAAAALTAAGAAAPADPVPVAPSLVGMKLIAVYLAEDVDPVTQDNVGQTTMIWLSSECGDDISSCDIGGTGGSYAHEVKKLFDFAPGTDAVNAALNAQGRDVEPGTYRYARVEFCKVPPGGQLTQPNVAWQVPGLAAPRELILAMCGVTSQPFAAPLVLKAGDTVAVTLAYDLALSVVRGVPVTAGSVCLATPAGQRCFLDCADDASGGTRTCFAPPVFTPSAVAGR